VIGIERLLAGIPGRLVSSREDLSLTEGYLRVRVLHALITQILEDSRWVRCARNQVALSDGRSRASLYDLGAHGP